MEGVGLFLNVQEDEGARRVVPVVVVFRSLVVGQNFHFGITPLHLLLKQATYIFSRGIRYGYFTIEFRKKWGGGD